MGELLAVLRVDPIARRNRALTLTLIGVLLCASALAVVRERRRVAQCRGAEARLSGIWDAARRQQIKSALGVVGAPAWSAIEQKIDRFAQGWVAASTQACEAARLRGTESAALFDRRTRCLDDRLSELRAATDLIAGDGKLGPRAAKLADSLYDVERCSDTTNLLLSDIDPPRRAEKAAFDRLRDRLSQEHALRIVGKYAESEHILPEIREQAQRLGYVALQAEADHALGNHAMMRGRYDEASELLHRSVMEAVSVHHDQVIASAWRDLAFIDLVRGRPEDGLVWTGYATAFDQRLRPPNAVRAGTASYRVAMLAQLGRNDEALAEAHHVLELAKMPAVDGYEASAIDAARQNAVAALAQIGHVEEALTVERDMYARALRTRGREHVYTVIHEIQLGQLLVLAGRPQEALPLAQESAQLVTTAFGPEAVQAGDGLAALGCAEADLGRHADAAEHLRRALAIYTKAEVNGAPIVDTLTRLAEVERALGKPDAPALLERAVRVGESAKVNPLLLAPARFALATRLPSGERARAVVLATQARDAYAAAAAAGADHEGEERDRVIAWLRSHQK
jgi:tetratricopeptide (TPR) repeat protein